MLNSDFFTETQDHEFPQSSGIKLYAYPNPFNPNTTISFNLPDEVKDLQLNIYNIRGQKIRSFSNLSTDPGYYNIVWEGYNDQYQNVTSGLYYCYLEYDGKYTCKKILYLK